LIYAFLETVSNQGPEAYSGDSYTDEDCYPLLCKLELQDHKVCADLVRECELSRPSHATPIIDLLFSMVADVFAKCRCERHEGKVREQDEPTRVLIYFDKV